MFLKMISLGILCWYTFCFGLCQYFKEVELSSLRNLWFSLSSCLCFDVYFSWLLKVFIVGRLEYFDSGVSWMQLFACLLVCFVSYVSAFWVASRVGDSPQIWVSAVLSSVLLFSSLIPFPQSLGTNSCTHLRLPRDGLPICNTHFLIHPI